MNRKIAAALVGLSILAGIGFGYAVQRSQDAPASAQTPSAEKSADGPTGASATSGRITVSGAFLVASRTAGATLVATLQGPAGVAVDGITAEIDGRTLPVAIGADGDAVDSNMLEKGPLRLGAKGVKHDDGSVYARNAYVVHDVKVGQRVQVTLDLNGASNMALDVPVVDADKVDDVALFEGPPPKFTDAKIVVFAGEERATLGYTLVSRSGRSEGTSVDRLTFSNRDGVPLNIELQHHTATGGPSGIGAWVKPETTVAARPSDGDYDYVDAAALKVGQTVTIHFPFPSGVSDVPFKVVAG